MFNNQGQGQNTQGNNVFQSNSQQQQQGNVFNQNSQQVGANPMMNQPGVNPMQNPNVQPIDGSMPSSVIIDNNNRILT